MDMVNDIRLKLDNDCFLVLPVDHGAFSDFSKNLSPAFEAYDLNFIPYKRGPYTKKWKNYEEQALKIANFDVEKERSLGLVIEDCLDQSNELRFGEYRIMRTPFEEPLEFIKTIKTPEYLLMFEDVVGSDRASSGLGAFVYGFELAKRAGIKGFYLAVSSDFSRGLADFAARRPEGRQFETPEDWIRKRAPHTWQYLVKKGIENFAGVRHKTDSEYLKGIEKISTDMYHGDIHAV